MTGEGLVGPASYPALLYAARMSASDGLRSRPDTCICIAQKTVFEQAICVC